MIPNIHHVDNAGTLIQFLGFMILITTIMMYILYREDWEKEEKEKKPVASFLDIQEEYIKNWALVCTTYSEIELVEKYARRIADTSREPKEKITAFRESVGKQINLQAIQLQLNSATLQR